MENITLIDIAIIDSQTLSREFLTHAINAWPSFQVSLTASNSNEFLDEFNKREDAPDVCIIDLGLKELNGYQVLRKLKKELPSLRILVLSEFYQEDALLEILSFGANGFLVKSHTSTNEIKLALQNIYTTGYYNSSIFSINNLRTARKTPPIMATLPKREIEFLYFCFTDLTYDEIARRMNVSKYTVETYRDNLFSKFHVHSRSGLLVKALLNGLVLVSELSSFIQQ